MPKNRPMPSDTLKATRIEGPEMIGDGKLEPGGVVLQRQTVRCIAIDLVG